ncbi:hypothetical protein LRS74_05860 [Streptomyces sp. LX-29]|uniref:hypothetical protein n=1 Tax=Streptomyces sp. LX-29 TaxID=2900152 RepID=UPI00240DED5E|nr:hypothetical protein [Streptomyces sp. LX-29]WFB06619.1 hypothetical protein LRS74_05860 [Streptomyces sp. LX-29]
MSIDSHADVAASPRDPDLAALAERSWDDSTHREALAELVQRGWTPCGVGDWAVAVRSPTGHLVARICPFDPAYAAFLELCRRCAGNPYLPRVALEAALDGGGTLTVLEYLPPLEAEKAAEIAERWRAVGAAATRGGPGDPDLAAVYRVAAEVDEEFRSRVPWWYGFDLNAGNVRRALDGRVVLVDVFCLDGEKLYGQVLADAEEVRRRIPEHRIRHLLEIPYIARESSPEEIAALRRAWTAPGHDG